MKSNQGTLIVRLAFITAFSIAMAFVESVVVVYIRQILGIVPTPVHLDEKVIEQVLREKPWLIPTEQWREAATIVMLAMFALLVGRSRWERFGVFLYTFGLWDIFYYVWLYVLIHWPPSLLTIDVLFLIPIPWIAPVIVPVMAATLMTVVGAWLMLRKVTKTSLTSSSFLTIL